MRLLRNARSQAAKPRNPNKTASYTGYAVQIACVYYLLVLGMKVKRFICVCLPSAILVTSSQFANGGVKTSIRSEFSFYAGFKINLRVAE